MSNRAKLTLLLVSVLLTLGPGCAFDLAHVKFAPATITAHGNEPAAFSLSREIPLEGAPCGYDRVLRANTRWQAVGKLPEGLVYRSSDQILTVECSNVYEAYIVVDQQKVIGFYLPVEKGFSPLEKPLQLAVSD